MICIHYFKNQSVNENNKEDYSFIIQRLPLSKLYSLSSRYFCVYTHTSAKFHKMKFYICYFVYYLLYEYLSMSIFIAL